jgi:hypothetical protein
MAIFTEPQFVLIAVSSVIIATLAVSVPTIFVITRIVRCPDDEKRGLLLMLWSGPVATIVATSMVIGFAGRPG